VAVHEQIKRMKKNRIDDYYLSVGKIQDALEADVWGLSALQSFRCQLRDLEKQAFKELMKEKLMANQSFNIFQTMLGQCLMQVDRLIDEKSAQSELDELKYEKEGDS
jgi:hypothetical protein